MCVTNGGPERQAVGTRKGFRRTERDRLRSASGGAAGCRPVPVRIRHLRGNNDSPEAREVPRRGFDRTGAARDAATGHRPRGRAGQERRAPAHLSPLDQAIRSARWRDHPPHRRARERAREHGPTRPPAGTRARTAQGGRKKTLATPAARRAAVRWSVTHAGVSERRACELVGMTRSVYRYRPECNPEREEVEI